MSTVNKIDMCKRKVTGKCVQLVAAWDLAASDIFWKTDNKYCTAAPKPARGEFRVTFDASNAGRQCNPKVTSVAYCTCTFLVVSLCCKHKPFAEHCMSRRQPISGQFL